ncbi:single-stranded-DNA-specific exonuclease RecJ [Arenimonas sp.]|uniref:single-stranded-DNA-specific exonuclease RecJ n=1 Tax=Arenimonas sp. TaxID=1872635 RepID=UPI0039E2CF57
MTGAARIVRRAAAEPGEWPAQVPDVLRRIYASRGVLNAADAELRLADLLPPDALAGMEAAVSLLLQAMASERHIVVVGDFDCDGATGTAVAVRGLRLLGAKRISYQVPNRAIHGYGLSPALVEDLVELAPDLLLTVDSGIACHAGVAAAKARGWQVLVTDHHLPGARLPEADAIVNPNLEGDGFESKAIAGVGVVFYLLLALRRRLREEGVFAEAQPDLSQLLDLVAIGTVADLVALDRNNRLLVAAGLRRIREGRCQAGVRALVEVSGRDMRRLSASDIGFSLAPRLNAAGRLEDMRLGIECLLADDAVPARAHAEALDRINGDRRERQASMVDDAEALLRECPEAAEGSAAGIVLFDPGWHAGIVGLVASRIKDRVHRPSVAFAPAESGSDRLRGSARSIAGFHIRDALAAIDAKHPGLIERFGGHAMAAGLSLRLHQLQDFRRAFVEQAAATLSPEQLQAECLSDGPLQSADFNRGLADALRLAGPWGQAFPEPVFDNVFDVLEWRVLGDRHLKFSLRPESGSGALSAIHFGGWQGVTPPSRLHAAYQLEPDDFRGRRDVQLLIRHWLPA